MDPFDQVRGHRRRAAEADAAGAGERRPRPFGDRLLLVGGEGCLHGRERLIGRGRFQGALESGQRPA